MSEAQAGQGNPQNRQPGVASRRPRRWLFMIAGVLVVLVILAGIGFVGASALEEHDSFCISCHTTPETTYFNRAAQVTNTNGSGTSAAVVDLATYHYQQAHDKNTVSFACIDCHRGDSSLGERVQTLTLGARDALIFVTGKADPTLEKTAIFKPDLPNAACVSCHQTTLLTVRGNETHYHNWLPQTAALIASGSQLITSNSGRRGRMRTVNTTVTCTSCHLAHVTISTGAQYMYVDKNIAQQACDSCHKAAGERPQSFDELIQSNP